MIPTPAHHLETLFSGVIIIILDWSASPVDDADINVFVGDILKITCTRGWGRGEES